ncbi:hypothetical protein PHLGIDRAFT_121379 [Phlebiopsis gigantea 11061_1 CR5-6]|uniref:Retrotransposon gag domain-containing protein n=1 Tax=Phlebiopsis gigantea (strain 11061_1 CR5-6) TaxID=745531 RepID=A0A0C3RT16_PHLG1|nr:hypothetical protein PHLGIDRAFT_121379 [Phlebiopsis gigantea 11061_1 CR5-6]
MKLYMVNSARDWVQAKTDGYNDLQAWSTFQTFLNDFEAAYKLPNEVSRAALELDSIHQDNLKPKTVTNLVSRFKVLLARAGTNKRNDIYLLHFKKALNWRIFEEILLLPNHPTTLAD